MRDQLHRLAREGKIVADLVQVSNHRLDQQPALSQSVFHPDETA